MAKFTNPERHRGHLETLSHSSENPVTAKHLTKLRQVLNSGPVLITTHENPDPDALAAGKAINTLIHATWGISTKLIYSGEVGRAENRAMLKILTPEWIHTDHWNDYSKFSCVVFVDCQPGPRNRIPINVGLPIAVIDHHCPITKEAQQADFVDIRPDIGSSVTMIYQYLHAAQVAIDPALATAMFFGLRADTNGLIRGASLSDGIVYLKLLEKLDHQLLMQIQSAGLTREYYQAFFRGIQDARVHGDAIVAFLGEMHRPDLTAELADLLFRYENVQAALCSGVYGQILHFSIRTGLLDQDAGFLVQHVIFPPGQAGGHGTMAGGQIPFEGQDYHSILLNLERRFLRSVGETGESRSLLE